MELMLWRGFCNETQEAVGKHKSNSLNALWSHSSDSFALARLDQEVKVWKCINVL